jgi:hypothetical protein
MSAIVLWIAAVVVVLVYGSRNLSRQPRQVARRSEQRNSWRRAARTEGGSPT